MDLEDAPQEDPDAGLSVGTVHAAFILSAAVAVALTFGKDLIKGKLSTNSDVGGQTPQFKAFQRTYLTVYLLMMAGDWLQGPYMYALYDAYGFKHEEIAALFVAGFFFRVDVKFQSRTRGVVSVERVSRRWRAGGVPLDDGGPPGRIARREEQKTHTNASWAPAGAASRRSRPGRAGCARLTKDRTHRGTRRRGSERAGARRRVEAGAVGAAHKHIASGNSATLGGRRGRGARRHSRRRGVARAGPLLREH